MLAGHSNQAFGVKGALEYEQLVREASSLTSAARSMLFSLDSVKDEEPNGLEIVLYISSSP